MCFIPVEAVDMFADKPAEILHKLGEVQRIRQQLLLPVVFPELEASTNICKMNCKSQENKTCLYIGQLI